MKRFILLLATGFGAGSFPKAPGTAGTVVGLLFYLLLKDLTITAYAVTIFTFLFFAAWVATEAEGYFGKKDPQSVVIDEVAGFLVTMAFVPFSWVNALIGFLLFRLFDIWKPFPCRSIERRAPAGWGVVGDDLMAGIYANGVLQLIWLVGLFPI